MTLTLWTYAMCGRFVRSKLPTVYQAMFAVPSVPDMPSYNITPTQDVAAVRLGAAQRECVLMRWGLIPFWSKDKKSALINARAETLASKPAFRDSFKKRRCLILADGYYEWKPIEGSKKKQPYYFRRQDDQPFAFAGIWDRWKDEAGPLESCAIVTTQANEISQPIHDRMPVMLEGTACEAWLDPDVAEPAALLELLRPFPSGAMAVYPIVSVSKEPPRPLQVEQPGLW